MTKANNKKSFAEEGLEAVEQETSAAELAVENTLTAVPSDGEDELVQVGGLEPVEFFYRTSAPKKPQKSPFKVIEKGEVITGTYERSFISGKLQKQTYLVRTANGKLIGLPSAGSLDKAMAKLAEGSKVKITYDGMRPITGGQWEGTDAHIFTVFGNK